MKDSRLQMSVDAEERENEVRSPFTFAGWVEEVIDGGFAVVVSGE